VRVLLAKGEGIICLGVSVLLAKSEAKGKGIIG
jgi:hypothetical protein